MKTKIKLYTNFRCVKKSTGELESKNIESYHIDLEKLGKKCCTNDERNELMKLLTMFITNEESELEELRSEEYMNDMINELERVKI